MSRTARVSSRFKGAFDPIIQYRGDAYFEAGRVGKPQSMRDKILVPVSGSESYCVEINWTFLFRSHEVLIRCSCPHYEGGEFCKHSWAALLRVDGDEAASPLLAALVTSDRMEVKHEAKTIAAYGPIASAALGLPEERASHLAPTISKAETLPKDNEDKPWLDQIQLIQARRQVPQKTPRSTASAVVRNPRMAHYCLHLPNSEASGVAIIEFYHQDRLKNGNLGAIRHQRVSQADLPLYENVTDRELLMILLGIGNIQVEYGYRKQSWEKNYPKVGLPQEHQTELLKRMAETGRLFYPDLIHPEKFIPVRANFSSCWDFQLHLQATSSRSGYRIEGQFVQGDRKLKVKEPELFLRSGILLVDQELCTLNQSHHFNWIEALRTRSLPIVPKHQVEEFIRTIYADSLSPELSVPESLQWKAEKHEPKVKVLFFSPSKTSTPRGLNLDLRFIYGPKEVSASDPSPHLVDSKEKKLVLRDHKKERECKTRLRNLPGIVFSESETGEEVPSRIEWDSFSAVADQLLKWGWAVEAKNKAVRASTDFEMRITSGLDWFDLQGSAKFGDGGSVDLPTLIAALQAQEQLIVLGDGSLGMIPEEWIKKYAPLAQAGVQTDTGFRFQGLQRMLVATWLAEDRDIASDKSFLQMVSQLKVGTQLEPQTPSKSFQGQLRQYQQEGLAWLDFMRSGNIGGILADDMGLGKTVQVLAHLEKEHLRLRKAERLPSLVIVPKSLMFNWKEEAHRFTPKLKVLAHEGPDRRALQDQWNHADLILVTYNTLRQDIEAFRAQDFHYLIADEAQAIKNSTSQAHQACRVLRGRHHLAMTGTPVENSLNDLFSIFDFASPGLIGQSIRSKMNSHPIEPAETASLGGLSRALRPFILRRTKEQVLKELPPKTEQLLQCELSSEELKHYDELRAYYRDHLKTAINKQGLGRSKIVVLEALLRLRQAACHRGLLDPKLSTAESTKLETLLEHLKELISEGHKSLVFSQFTSFLDLVEDSLRANQISFERLDGSTSAEERRKRVSRFQNGGDAQVFLISLKAGGVGLNLTAADYVFILDPWWNPAVEAQAIDRTHRIGQKNKVMAYRLIAKNTVEEKILALQKTKRELADALVSENSSLLRKLNSEDIDFLLS